MLGGNHMKTLKSAVLRISEFVALVTGLMLLAVCEVNSVPFLLKFIAVFIASACVACYLSDKHSILSRIIGIGCVLIAFVAEHKRKLTASELILLRRKNQFGSYSQLYSNSIERYYDTVQ